MTSPKTPATDPNDKSLQALADIMTEGTARKLDPLPERQQSKTAAKPTAPDRQASADQRPYTLESANLEQELDRQRRAALSEIEAVEAEVLSIETRANSDISSIRARADAEIQGRRHRAEDLNKIVAMADRALTPPPSPTEAAQQAIEDDMAARRAAKTEGTDQ